MPDRIMPDRNGPDSPPKPRGKIVADPELLAMNKIARLLEPLPIQSRQRIAAWITARVTDTLVLQPVLIPKE